MLPTALIPFCEFGGSISAIGAKIDQLDVPVCNSFRPKILRDQLCYTVDPNKYKDNIKIQRDTLGMPSKKKVHMEGNLPFLFYPPPPRQVGK